MGVDMCTYVLAASARTFSRRWHAPPPFIQFKEWSTLKNKIRVVDSAVTDSAHSSAPSRVTSIVGY